MFRFDRVAASVIFCAALVASVVLLADYRVHTGRHFESVSYPDQSRYAEIATTTDQGLLPIASSTQTRTIPILVYHIVRPSYPDDSRAVRALALTPETFDSQMAYLARAGYHVIPLSVLEDFFMRGTPLPAKPVALTFDDGWKDQFTYAFPILKEHQYTATFFVFTNAIGRRSFLSWDDVKAMRDAHMTIGSHSLSHPYLTRVAASRLWGEISDSKHILEDHLKVPVTEFAYPFGQYNPVIVSLVRKAGYRSARGDFESGEQSFGRLYELSALNAPTTVALFEKTFPSTGYAGVP